MLKNTNLRSHTFPFPSQQEAEGSSSCGTGGLQHRLKRNLLCLHQHNHAKQGQSRHHTHGCVLAESQLRPEKALPRGIHLLYLCGLLSPREWFLPIDTPHSPYLSRSKDSLLGVSDETLFAEQVGICTLCQLLKWKLPVAAAALDQLAVLRAIRNTREMPHAQGGGSRFHIPSPRDKKQPPDAIKQR